jgi:hypothetical protein
LYKTSKAYKNKSIQNSNILTFALHKHLR